LGPLHGVKVVELAALGPAPMGTMLLADLGADVVRIERKLSSARSGLDLFNPKIDVLRRSRTVVTLDLKRPEAVETALGFAARADVLIEGFRPGVMERLGLGPEDCLARNCRLVYARMTGWGQSGPWAHVAGHDINYLSLTGALHAIGEKGCKPTVPLNVVADGGGGAMLLAFGVLAALTEARTSGRGQVVDVAMTDGTALLMSMMHTLKAMGQWSWERGDNLLDGGAHFYGTYRCSDGKYVAVGAIEPQFYAHFLERAGIDDPDFGDQWRRERWPFLKQKLEAVFAARTRDEWCKLFDGTDACVTPVLDMDEAPGHLHNRSRNTFIRLGDVTQAAPAPRFTRTPAARPRPPSDHGDTRKVLTQWGLSDTEIDRLKSDGSL